MHCRKNIEVARCYKFAKLKPPFSKCIQLQLFNCVLTVKPYLTRM